MRAWADEAAVALARAVDLSATSDELADLDLAGPDPTALRASRADVVRALEVPARASVLVVGAGCGQVASHLAEVARRVRAWEPDPDAAAVARARLSHASNATVRTGSLADVPADERADIVVAVEGFEALAAEHGLDAAVAALATHVGPRGTLVVATANRAGLGVLAGDGAAPDGAPSRAELARALRRAGLDATVLAALPDHRHARLVVAAGGFAGGAGGGAGLAVGAAHLPPHQRPAWRRAVAAGLGVRTAPGLVALGVCRRAEPLWPAGRLAVAHTSDRRAAYATRTVLRTRKGRTTVTRTRLDGAPGPVDHDGLRHVVPDGRWVPGRDLLDVAADSAERRPELLAAWAALAEGAVDADGRRALDAVPRNVVVDERGRCRLIDQEWWALGVDVERVLGRGLLGAALHLAADGGARALAAELAAELAGAGGPTLAEGWLDRAARDEARLRARVERRDELGTRASARRHTDALRAELDVAPPPTPDEVAAAHAAFARTHAELLDAQAEIRRLHAEVAARDDELLVRSRREREAADDRAALVEEAGAARAAAVAAADEVGRQAAATKVARAELLDARAAAADAGALREHLVALHATMVMRWTAPARRWWARLKRTEGPSQPPT